MLTFLKKYSFILFCVIALILPDRALKGLFNPGVFTEFYVGAVSTLFSLGWIFLIVYLCVFVMPKKAGKIVFIIISSLFILLSFSEYIYYKIFGQLFWLKSIVLAGEGADYLGYVMELIDLRIILHTILSIVSLLIASLKWKHPVLSLKQKCLVFIIPVSVLLTTHICMQPELHRDEMNQWDSWRKPRVVYNNFNDANKSFETTGLYQFTFRNIYTGIFPDNNYDKKEYERVDEYFIKKGEPKVNEYTGIFEGKNVIAVMMESMDTWTIDQKNTPTLYEMMNNSINFTNYNAPLFGSGFTFNSEFAFNTGLFTPLSAVSAANFSSNSFPYSLANLFKKAGYTTNSFHFNNSEFYNRGIMHKSFGYEEYNSSSDFGLTGTEAELDSNLLKNDDIYNKMISKTPFFDFIITYSAHLPYTGDNKKLLLAKQYRPDLINKDINEEKNNVQILAADTDEFFRQLLEKLENDGLLEDTVIIAYTDHFAYGVSDEKLLKEWKGKSTSYNVPAFIYAKGIEPVIVEKPMMTIDWAPTIVNLFSLSKDARYIGNDILEPSNNGFVYYENWGWQDEKMTFFHSDEEPLSENIEHIEKQNERVKQNMEINDIIVLGDYYK